jgi:AraC family transcriptional regulator
MSQLVGAYDGRFGRLYAVTTSRRQVAHAHQDWQFIFHLHGPIADFRVEGTPFPVSEGELLAIPPWTTHAKAHGAQGPCSMLSLLVSAAWHRDAQVTGLLRTNWPNAVWCSGFSDRVRRLLERLCTIVAVDSDSSAAEFEADLVRLLATVVVEHSSAPTRRQMAPRARHIDHRIRKALEIIRNSKTPDINLGEVARKVGLSRSHFYKRFKECVGTSPLHVVDSARIGTAVRMLGETDEPIAALAEQLGFSTQGHFTRFFVQHLFIPPTRYREWLRAEPHAAFA